MSQQDNPPASPAADPAPAATQSSETFLPQSTVLIVDDNPQNIELLQAFLRRKGRLLTRDFLIDEVWGPDYFGDTKTLDVHVKRLRRKIEEDPHRPVHLLTVRGLGYKFVD